MQRDDRRVRLWTRNGQPGGLRLFTLSATGCSGAKLLVLMTTLAEIKQWRLTLTPDTGRLRMNQPGTALKNCWRATAGPGARQS